jgi:hypothetical protein
MTIEHKQTPIVRCQSLLALHSQLTSRKSVIQDLLDEIEPHIDSSVGALVFDAACRMELMYNDLCEEIIHLSVYEPGLRYWMQKSWPFHVWASTLDEAARNKVLGVEDSLQEIDFTDYQELRKQEYARLTPTEDAGLFTDTQLKEM